MILVYGLLGTQDIWLNPVLILSALGLGLLVRPSWLRYPLWAVLPVVLAWGVDAVSGGSIFGSQTVERLIFAFVLSLMLLGITMLLKGIVLFIVARWRTA